MTALRVAVLGESETDDAVAREIVAHVRSVTVEPVRVPSLRVRGWPAIYRQLPQVVRTIYYQSDADALVVLADTDASVPHDPSTHSDTPSADCRWCMLDRALRATLAGLRPRGERAPLHTALGTPVPAVEAWLLAGRAPHPSEAAWLQRGLAAAAASVAYKRELKRAAYGSDAPHPDRVRIASHLIRETLAGAAVLPTMFPGGFAVMEGQIRAW